MQTIDELKQCVSKARAELDSARLQLELHWQSPLRAGYSKKVKNAELKLEVAEANLRLRVQPSEETN